MNVFLNGRFVPAEQACVSVFDRGFLYGDGLFESIRACDGQLILWNAHIDRLRQGAAALRISLPFEPETLRSAALELLRQNALPNAILRIHVSRGPGPRGYSIRGAASPSVVITTHPAPRLAEPAPTPWRLFTARFRLPANDPIAGFKTASKLTHVLARAEAEAAGADEALLLNTDGHLAETSAANLFWLSGQTAFTPHLHAGCLNGVTRDFLLPLLRRAGWKTEEVLADPAELASASSVFVTLSSLGIVEISHLDNQAVSRDPRLSGIRSALVQALTDSIRANRICH